MIIPINNKYDRSSYESHREISLVSIAFKPLSSTILLRLTSAYEICTCKNQVGLRFGQVCIDQLFIPPLNSVHGHTFGRPAIPFFFDRATLCVSLNSVSKRSICLIRPLDANSGSRVRDYSDASLQEVFLSGVSFHLSFSDLSFK